MAETKQKTKVKDSKFAKFSLFFFDHPKLSLLLAIELILVGVLSYSVFLKREGFPPVEFPTGVVSGTYFVDDAEKVDKDVTSKISEATKDVEGIERVDTVAASNFFTVVANYSSEQTSKSGNELLKKTLEESADLPEQVGLQFTAINPSQFLNEYDALISVHAKNGQTAAELEKTAAQIAKVLGEDKAIDTAEVVAQLETAVNPFTGQEETIQSSFAGVGLRSTDQLQSFRAVTVGVRKFAEYDAIQMSESLSKTIDSINSNQEYAEVGVEISADYAESIHTQVDGLVENMITALIVVAIISFLLISWRVSLLTAIVMVTVLLTTMFVMFLIGSSINTITLFGLVLALGLFVDDVTVIAEAIDANKSKNKKPREVVKMAISKVGAASFSGSLTTILMFVPLMFVTGILGAFIRILPITVIIALATSIILSLSMIPFLSRYMILNPRSLKAKSGFTLVKKIEDAIVGVVVKLINQTKKSQRRAIAISMAMIIFSTAFIFVGGAIGSKLKFNIFPPTKDGNQLSVTITYPPQTTIQDAEDKAKDVAEIVENSIGGYVTRYSIGSAQPANNRSADILIELVPYKERDIKSPELMDQLTQALDTYKEVRTRVVQIDAGPPTDQYPFKVQVYGEDSEQIKVQAEKIQAFLEGSIATRPNGTSSQITETKQSYFEDVARRDGRKYVQVEASYSDTDTTALVVATKDTVQKEFPDMDLEFDFGFESENQESFSSLPIVGLVALAVMFILLAFQFRSIVQPLMIFLAIPFSFFGVMLGLYVTSNPISFFVMVGIFGLIGISVNNTILVIDYANQARREGARVTDAIISAMQSRIRPLITTTTTTVVALLPLALTDPFWESLSYTIIFGLVSSTFFVILSFPFYYLLIEGARSKFKAWRMQRKGS